MKFYHGTSKENWEQIKKEGILFGRRYVLNDDGSVNREVDRCTYLAVEKEEAQCYGDVVLEVEFDPASSKHNNYKEGCWQVRVYEPIPLSHIKLLSEL